MTDARETIADIVAEMHDEAARADMEQGYSLDDAAEMMREFASRVDAAAKRMEWKHKKELEVRDAVIQTEVAAREAERDAHKREITILIDTLSEVVASIEVRFPAIGYAIDRKPYLYAKKILEQYKEEAALSATSIQKTQED